MARVTIYLPDALHARVKASGMNVSAVSQAAITEHLGKQRPTRSRVVRVRHVAITRSGRDGSKLKPWTLGDRYPWEAAG